MARGVTGNFQSNPRVFAHDAVSLVSSGSLQNYSFGDTISGTESEFNSGVCLYVGIDLDVIEVTMEQGGACKFMNLKAGMFVPILIKAVNSLTTADGANTITQEGALVALY